MNSIKSTSKISLTDVHKTYHSNGESVEALRGVSMEVLPGEFLAIAGPSGSGKSTLLNLIGGLDKPTAGKIYFGEEDLTSLSDAKLCELRLNSIGFIFQSYNLIPILSAVENVEYVMLLQKIGPEVRRRKSLEILEEVGLTTMATRRPSELSGGQQQRVAVARAIVSHPLVVLADEPTANLDSHTATSLMDLMAELNVKKQITFLFSSHDPLVLSRAKRIIRLHDGRVES